MRARPCRDRTGCAGRRRACRMVVTSPHPKRPTCCGGARSSRTPAAFAFSLICSGREAPTIAANSAAMSSARHSGIPMHGRPCPHGPGRRTHAPFAPAAPRGRTDTPGTGRCGRPAAGVAMRQWIRHGLRDAEFTHGEACGAPARQPAASDSRATACSSGECCRCGQTPLCTREGDARARIAKTRWPDLACQCIGAIHQAAISSGGADAGGEWRISMDLAILGLLHESPMPGATGADQAGDLHR
jgi:hypothetical protein